MQRITRNLSLCTMMFCCATAFAQNVIHIELENSINRISIPKGSREIVIDTPKDNKFGNLDTGEKTWEETSIEQRLFYRLSSGLFSSRTDCLPLEYCICKSGYNVLAHHDFTKPTRLVNPETNKKIYSKAITPFFIDSEKDILIGTASDYTVYAYRLSTGKWLWECKIEKSELEVVNNVIRVDEDHIVFTTKELNYLDINSGKIASLASALATSNNNSTGGALGAMFGLLGTIADVCLTSGNMVETQSGFVKDKDNLFLADQSHIFCFDTQLRNRWYNTFEDTKAGHSKFCFEGDTIILINEAYGLHFRPMYGNVHPEIVEKNIGVPFIAKFSREDGKLLSKDVFPNKWDKNVFGKTLNFITEPLFLLNKTDRQFSRLKLGNNEYVLNGSNGRILVIDNKMNVLRYYEKENVFTRETSDETPGITLYKNAASYHLFYIAENNKIKRQFIGKDFLDVSLKCGKLIIVKEKSLDIEKLA